MILSEQAIVPPIEWQHKPDLCDNDNETVAMKLAKKGIKPPVVWIHNNKL